MNDKWTILQGDALKLLEGYTATGIEVTDDYARLARERIERELAGAA